MNIYQRLTLAVFLPAMILTVACNTNHSTAEVAETVTGKDDYSKTKLVTTPVPAWAEMLRHDSGWIGADGIYCTALTGIDKPGQMNEASETMFWFSDCIIGNIDSDADTLKGAWQMMNNSVAYFKGANPDPSSIQYYWRKDTAGNPLSMFEPSTPKSQPGYYYWLGDGFMNHANDSTIYIFAYLIRNVPGSIFPFEDLGVSLIALSK